MVIKVVAITDKRGTAIDRLARGLEKYHTNFEYHVVDYHPKRASEDQKAEFEKHLDADIFDFQYFRTAQTILKNYDIKGKKILSHYNPYSITESDWNEFDLVTAPNKSINQALLDITTQPVEYVPLTVDTDFWTFNTAWTPNNRVLMVANRIESKKGIKEVAEACKVLGLKFALVGAISDPDYFHEVIKVGGVEFYPQITDKKLRHLYHNSTVHVCNSVDKFESGTLPILEAMLCGTPVLTRKVGHVPDLYNKENMVILETEKEDVENITNKLKNMIEDPENLRTMRDKAWQTAKSRSNERRAYTWQKIYRQVLYPNQESVSVILPVYEKPEITFDCITAIENQTYKNIEVIMINDGESPQPKSHAPFFKCLDNNEEDYGLARARNKGIIEATGSIIVFCDQRIIMEPDAIENLVKYLKPRTWVYGTKGVKKEFVENFSAVRREDIIRAGMFCERITEYGGMSEEVRSRFRWQGGTTEFVESAKAVQIGKSSNRNRQREQIIRMKNRLSRMEYQ